MAEYKYFFNGTQITEQEWNELVRVEVSCEEQSNQDEVLEEQLSLF